MRQCVHFFYSCKIKSVMLHNPRVVVKKAFSAPLFVLNLSSEQQTRVAVWGTCTVSFDCSHCVRRAGLTTRRLEGRGGWRKISWTGSNENWKCIECQYVQETEKRGSVTTVTFILKYSVAAAGNFLTRMSASYFSSLLVFWALKQHLADRREKIATCGEMCGQRSRGEKSQPSTCEYQPLSNHH